MSHGAKYFFDQQKLALVNIVKPTLLDFNKFKCLVNTNKSKKNFNANRTINIIVQNYSIIISVLIVADCAPTLDPIIYLLVNNSVSIFQSFTFISSQAEHSLYNQLILSQINLFELYLHSFLTSST